MNFKVPMSSPDLTAAEREAVMQVLKTPTLSMGHWVEDFERSFVEFTGRKHAVAVSSGTTGLHLCVRAAGIAEGDLVITTPFSFVASANVLLYERAIPIFVDVDGATGNIDPEMAAQAARDLSTGGDSASKWLPRRSLGAKKRLRSILAVDVFGQPADLDRLRSLADSYGVSLIEDACEALGAEYKGRATGTAGDYAVFAFYPNKQITTGEGGIVVTDDGSVADLMRALRNQGRAAGDTWLQHTHLGYNYRLDEMSAALGVAQMRRLPELLKKRGQVGHWYRERLEQIPGVEPPKVESFTTRMSWFVYVVHFEAQLDRDVIARRLTDDGIPVRPYFLPIHLQPYMVERFGYQPGDFPVTEDLGRRGLALPFSGIMTEEQVDTVCAAIRKALTSA